MSFLRKFLDRIFASSAENEGSPLRSSGERAQGRSVLEVGQSWTYRDAPNAASRVVIGRLDKMRGYGTVVSVCITNVPVPGSEPGKSEVFDIFHAPITEDVLTESLLELVGQEATSPDFEEGYADWRASLEDGEAGVFTISPVGVIGLYGRVPKRA
jgi:hypothetical protein